MLKIIYWGMVGCGDVTEVKSGPAFNKVADSKLVAVLGRNEQRVKDYALRHGIKHWYVDPEAFFKHPGLNAIYIATPPDVHLEYANAAFEAGMHVYVEKPMALNYAQANLMSQAAENHARKLVVAHYRSAQPMFKKVQSLLKDNQIGKPLSAQLDFRRQPLCKEDLQIAKTEWRVDPARSGGGLFYDMAPHQIGLLYFLFGDIENSTGYAIAQNDLYAADDIVSGIIKFENGILFNGLWNFSSHVEKDNLTIVGSKGVITFSVFDKQEIVLVNDAGEKRFKFDKLEHVQQPLIAEAVQYFLGQGKNPCAAAEGTAVMRVLDSFTNPI